MEKGFAVRMGIPSEEEVTGHTGIEHKELPASYAEMARRAASDDSSSDDDGKNLKSKPTKKKHSNEESSSSSSSSSSSKSSHHHHHEGDDETRAQEDEDEDEVVSKNGVHDNAHEKIVGEIAAPEKIDEEPTIYGANVGESDNESASAPGQKASAIEEVSEVEDREIGDEVKVEQEKGIRDESEGDGALEETSFDSLQGSEAKEYHVVVSETEGGDGRVDTAEVTSEPKPKVEMEVPEPVDEVAVVDADSPQVEDESGAEFVSIETSVPPEETAESEPVVAEPAEEDSAKDVIGESLVEKREISDVVVAESEEESEVEGQAELGSAEKSVLAETEEVQNGNAQEVMLERSTDHSSEIEGKSEHDECFEGEEDIQALPKYRDLSVQVASPLELKNRLLKPTVTPSPPKRESSVYKIVMALEGLQIGEKCIHGEIDHGVCHQRYGDKKSSSPSFSPSTTRDTSRDSSISPKDGDRTADASPSSSPKVRVSDVEKREVDNEWSFVQHDSNSTTQLSSSTRTETYTDTVVFRRDDGFLPRTPGRSPLSGSQSMRAVFSQAEASGSTTPTLKIVHEFPAEQDGANAATLEGESEVERILRLQETHDLVCPVCRSCITKRVILRKRKRTSTISSIEKWETEVEDGEESSGEQVLDTNAGDTVVEEYENYGCLSCFTFLFRRERSAQRTEVIEVPRATEVAAVAPVAIPSDQSAAALPDSVAALPPAPAREDYDNRCLPIFFTWRRKTTSTIDSEIAAPLLSKEKRSEDSSVEVVRTEARDVSAEDNIQQISTSQEEQISTPEIKQISTSESKEITVSEIQQASTSEVQQRPDAGTLTLPAAPGVVEGVQIPVVVVESREDRLCFPFLWRRTTKSTQVHPELLQPLLTKEDVEQKSDEVEQQPTEIKQQVDDVKQESQQTEDFSRIEDDLWMRREVLLEVPVSVSPQEEPRTPGSSSQTPEISAQPDTSVPTRRVTEEERRANCLCFPSWSSSETTIEETETSRITNSQQGALSTWASVTEATEKLQTSTSQRVVPSTDLKKVVTTAIAGTEGSEISLSSPSFKGAVLPVASGTQDRETQKASLNCMEILIPSYPWGSPGRGRMKEVREKAEEHTGDAASTSFHFSSVGQIDSKSPLILPGQAVAESSKQPGSQPNQSPAEIVLAQTTERREDSTCFPLSLPTLSWRRQEFISGEIVDGSSKTRAAEVTSSATSVSKSSVASETNSSVSLESKSSVSLETKSWVTTETKSWVSSETKSSSASESKSSVDSESKSFGTAETVIPQGKVVEKEFVFGDIEVSRNQNQEREQNYNDSAVELVDDDDEEEEPLKRKPPASKKLTPSEVEPLPLPVEVNERVVVSEETDNSSLSEILERDLSFSQDLTRTENVSTELPVGETHEDETREKGSWNCCLPSYLQLAYQPIEDSVTPKQAAAPASSDALPGASISHVSDKTESPLHAEDTRETTTEEETREKGSWNCCLPSYSQLAYQPIDRVTDNQAAVPASYDAFPGASLSPVSDKKESTFHEEVTKETTIDARIKTEVKTTRFSTEADHAESIDSVRVDTTVSYVHGKVQHDKGDAEGTLLLDDHPTLTFHPVDPVPDLEDSKTSTQPPLGPVYSTGYAALSRFLEDEDADAEITERLADASWQDVGQKETLPSEAVTEVERDFRREEIQKSEAVTKTEQDIGDEIKLVTPVPELVILPDSAQQDVVRQHERDGSTGRIQEEEDGSCCGSSSKWFWNRRKFTTEEAQLQEPLLGRDSAQLGQPIVLQTESEVDSQDSSVHVTIQQTHEVTEMRSGDKVVATEEEWCHCFPWSARDLTDTVGTTVTVTTDDTVIEVEGTDATNTLAAATHAAEDAGMMDEPVQEGDYLKSIVYGGLDVSLTSLGVVAAAAGGDAKTQNILALGLSNLIFGFLTFFYKIQDLHKERPARFHESVGPRFWINGPLAMLSFLFFGALPVLTFAFSFRQLNDHDYKMAATVLASTIAIIFLGCGKVAAKMTEMSYRRTLTTLISTGIVASVAGFYTGEYISKLLTKYGILDE